MDSLLVTLFAYLLFAVLPFKLAATWFGAERDNWNSCFVALVFNSILGGGAMALLGGGLTVALFGTLRGIVAVIPALVITGLSNWFSSEPHSGVAWRGHHRCRRLGHHRNLPGGLHDRRRGSGLRSFIGTRGAHDRC